MALSAGLCMLCILIATLKAEVLGVTGNPIELECFHNVMRVTLDKDFLVGKRLRIDGVYKTNLKPLTAQLAPVCGCSVKTNPLGDVTLFASVQNCFSQYLDGDRFNTTLNFKLFDDTTQTSERTVSKICQYNQQAFREILCDRNYVEVSVKRSLHKKNLPAKAKKPSEQVYWLEDVAEASEFKIWKMLFHTPGGDKTMTVHEVEQQGYFLNIQPERLVLRGPRKTAETYIEDVSGVPMQVMKSSMFFKQKWMVMQVYVDGACPAGGVTLTDEVIVWSLPIFISPIISRDEFTLLQFHMGMNGQRLDNLTMAARGYVLSRTDSHITVTMPLGAVDGYYKSHVQDGQYHVTFAIEPMLEMLWQEDYAETKYKVLFPIITPLLPRRPHVVDYTVPDRQSFNFVIGTFLSDVVLMNLTFPNEVLSIAQAATRGINVQEQAFENSSKAYSLDVPFGDPVVLKNAVDTYTTFYTLPLLVSLQILPEQVAFQQPVVLEAKLKILVVPSALGFCNDDDGGYFYVTVKFGSLGEQVKTTVGSRQLTPEVAEEYKYQQNATHFSIAVPFESADVIYEMVQESVIRGRLDLVFWDHINLKLNEFSLACSFPKIMTACYPNGTISAMAAQVESVPSVNLGLLSLRDESCTPVFSNERFAHFIFNANTCGTTRRENVMVYENEIALPGKHKPVVDALGKVISPVNTNGQDLDYRFRVLCQYGVNTTQIMAFNIISQPNMPVAEVGVGEFILSMKLSLDASYTQFYNDDDYPVKKLLREPLYFEVELMVSIESMELFLENCWATAEQNMDSQPRWDIILDSCENTEDRRPTVFHPVPSDSLVTHPRHHKRFEIKMFSFVNEQGVHKGQIIVHCAVILCDLNSTQDNQCNKPCMAKQRGSASKNFLNRARRSATFAEPLWEQVSSGRIIAA